MFGQYGSIAHALSPEQKKVFQEGINYYDVATPCDTGAETATPVSDSQTNTTSNKNIYLLGDSVLVGAYYTNGFLEKNLNNDGWSPSADASGGRGMSYAGSDPRGDLPGKTKSGLDAIGADQNAIKASDTVVIELGTNETDPPAGADKSSDLFKSEMEQAISKVKQINPSAKIYWVNLFSNATQPFTPWVKQYNQVIDSVASDKGISVIDTTQAGISLSPDGIHPDTAGYRKLSDTIASGLNTASTPSDAASGQCCGSAGVSDASLVGGTNEEKVWNYFIGKGLTPVAVAGIMGNISVESGFDPQNIQDPGGRSKNPDDAGQAGWGLIQFTPGSSVYDWAKAAQVSANPDNVYFLSTQLDIIWGYMQHSTGDRGGNMLEEFKAAAKDPHSAAKSFEEEVENAGVFGDRYDAADAAMQKYGQSAAGTVSPGGGSAASGGGCDTGEGAVPGDLLATVKNYAWPDYSSSRSDPKPAYKKAYDQAVAQGQYGGGGYTDCGAFVTRAMIDSGYEPAYNYSGDTSKGAGNTPVEQAWLDKNWQKINVSSTKDLQPGDVAINSVHTYMYVGNIPGFHGNSASASEGSRTPMASDYYDDGFTWYRKK